MQNRLFLVRHGENQANLTKEFSYSKVDYALTPKGRLQAQQTGAYFRGQGIDTILCSPLKRASETAQIIAEELGLPFEVVENFREINVGMLEDMKNRQEGWQIHNRVIAAWLNGRPEVAFPGGENYWSARDRMRAGVERALAGRQGGRIMVVGHGGLFICTLSDLCPAIDMEAILSQEAYNCAISELEMRWTGCRWEGELSRWAFSDHMHGEAAELITGYKPEIS
jgi:probable phosphoglycerate mutase